MTNKIKTLTECKNQVLENHNWSKGMTWIDFIEVCKKDNLWISFEEMSDEAVELYAGDENRKKDEPKQSDVELAKSILSKGNQCWISEDIEMIDETSHIAWADILKAMFEFNKQSQQPVSIQWLSDEEMQKQINWRYTDGSGFGNNLPESVHFITGAKWLQSELQKRVNSVDPVEFLEWTEKRMWTKWENIPGGFKIQTGWYNTHNYEAMKNPLTGQELLQKYIEHLTSKPQSNGN
jgi:hypothetical protein